MDRVEGALRQRLHRDRQARHPDPQPRIERHLDLRHRRQTPIHIRIRPDHLDLKAPHPALANLLDRARHTMRRPDPIRQDRHPRSLALPRIQPGLLTAQKRRRRRIRDRRHTPLEHTHRRAHQIPPARDRLHHLRHRPPQFALMRATRPPVQIRVPKALLLHIRDQAPLVQVIQPHRHQPRPQQLPRILRRHLPAHRPLARLALAQHPLHHHQHPPWVQLPSNAARPCVLTPLQIVYWRPPFNRARPTLSLSSLALDTVAQCPCRQRYRRVRPLRRAALRAPCHHTPRPHMIQELPRRARRRRLRERAPNVNPRMVIAATYAHPRARAHIDRRRAVQFARPRSISHLPDREQVRQPPAVACPQRCAHRVVRMRQRAHDPLCVQVLRALLHIAPMRLQPLVVLPRDPITQHMHRLRLSPEARRQLLRHEHIRAPRYLQHPRDRVMVRDRHEVHPATLRQLVHLLRWRRALRQPHRPLHPQPRFLRRPRVHVHVHSRSCPRPVRRVGLGARRRPGSGSRSHPRFVSRRCAYVYVHV
jgi:hypothetical protein